MITRNKTIAVISHEIDTFENSGYLLNRLAEEWAQQGIRLAVIRGTEGPLPEADLAVLHTDITTVGDDYGRIVDHYARVINGRVRTTTKTSFSALIVNREDRYPGPVIVKTDNNYGGSREAIEGLESGDTAEVIEVQRPWRRVKSLEQYPVFRSPSEVPLGVWKNPALVVEKFLPERNAEGEYLLRVWVFLGNREIYYQCVSSDPVIKSDNTIRREPLDPSDIPQSVRETRASLGFDYGKFDFCLHEGKAVLYDVNRTPGFPRSNNEPDMVKKNMEWLSGGLDCFFEERDR